ncbi:MAG: antibiotic biosynthesis monooxygenase [Caldilineaceae bacterium]|nr:antibiotic biosynthesis monooxygenase [Caldilineaceae bacterium]
MIVVRFKVTCKPEMIGKAKAAFAAVIAPSQRIEGVLHFDIAQDLADPNSLIATEVFEDRAALARQEALPEVQTVIEQLPAFLAAAPEATVYNVSSSEPWGE